MKYPFTPEMLDATPEPLAELYRELELKMLTEICSRLKIADNLNEVTVQDIRVLRSHGIDLEEIKNAIKETSGTDQIDKLFDDVVSRNQEYYSTVATMAGITVPQTMVSALEIDAIRRQTRDTFRNLTRSMGFFGRQRQNDASVCKSVSVGAG